MTCKSLAIPRKIALLFGGSSRQEYNTWVCKTRLEISGRAPLQMNAGAWTGTIFKVGEQLITKSVSQEWWERGWRTVTGWAKLLGDSADGCPQLNRMQLEKETGFMNHLAMTSRR